MDFFAAISSSLISIIFFCMIVAGVLKLFQIGTLLTEIKDVLQNQRHQNSVPPVAAHYERPAAQPAAAQWAPAAPTASRAPATSDYPSYNAMNSGVSAPARETAPQVIRQTLVPEVSVVPMQAYALPAADPVHPQETVALPLDTKMSGEEMLRALDLELRAEEARRTTAVVDTTIVASNE